MLQAVPGQAGGTAVQALMKRRAAHTVVPTNDKAAPADYCPGASAASCSLYPAHSGVSSWLRAMPMSVLMRASSSCSPPNLTSGLRKPARAKAACHSVPQEARRQQCTAAGCWHIVERPGTADGQAVILRL